MPMETPSREQILKEWEKLAGDEQQRLVAQHLRDTLYSSPLYKEMADKDEAATGNPMEYWDRLSSSYATAIPMSWIARFGVSYTPAELYEVRDRLKQEQEQKQKA
jgi:hypothetical protein